MTRSRVLVGAVLGTAVALGGCGGGPKKGGHDGGEPETAVEMDCEDGADNDGDGLSDCDDLDCRLSHDACELAPELDRSVATTVAESAAFLYTGKDPLQRDADAEAFDAHRIAIARGKVVDRDGEPLSGVKVSVLGAEQYGHTFSRSDGVFDMAVNGGGRVVFQYELEGYLSAQRVSRPGWQRYARLPEVGLVQASADATTVVAEASSTQVVRGEEVEDDFGARQPFAVFQPDTEVSAVLPDGSQEDLTDFAVSITEYPFEMPSIEDSIVQSAGTARFAPGTLPSSGGVHYGLEFTVTEAEELGAHSVRFSEPVALYVDNFLGLSTGTPVPLGYYDEGDASWQDIRGGRVVEVLEVSDGIAVLDVDGDGEEDDEDTLDDLDITRGELRELGARYEAGATLWRTTVSHFSPFDVLLPVTAPPGAAAPSNVGVFSRPLEQPSRRGSALVETQALNRSVDIVGTPYSLEYLSDRTTGYGPGFELEVPVTGEEVPAGMQLAVSVVDIAGRRFSEVFEPEPNQVHKVVWNGEDSFGRLLQGPQTAQVSITYTFDGELAIGEVFGIPETGSEADSDFTPPQVALSKNFETTLGVFDAQGYQLGGFGIDVLHAYDPAHQIVFFGYGDIRSAQNVGLVVKRFDQNFDVGNPDGVTLAPDGSAIITDDQEEDGASGRILRVDREGNVSVLAGPGAPGEAGDIELISPQGVAVKSDGTLFVADFLARAVREIRPDGSVRTLVSGLIGDDPLIDEDVDSLDHLALGLREELYIVDQDRVLRFEAGELTVFAGGGDTGSSNAGDGGPAVEAELSVPSGVAVGPDGSVFISERGPADGSNGSRVRRVSPEGIITTVAGTGQAGFSGDGQKATDAELGLPRGVAVGPDGSIYIADQFNDRIRRVTPDGIIHTIVGGGDADLEDGQLANKVIIDAPDGIAVAADGTLFVASPGALYKVAPGLPEITDQDSLIPSTDGRTLFRFDSRGKHRETIDAMTGVTELSFQYDDEGTLEGMVDKNGLFTEIQRDQDGLPRAIVSPFGQTTELEVEDGLLRSVEDELGRTVSFDYTTDDRQLMERFIDPKGGRYSYEYDELGRLERCTDPTGFFETLQSEKEPDGTLTVSVTTPESVETEYLATPLSDGTLEREVREPGEEPRKSSDAPTLRTMTLPDGSQVRTLVEPDPEFGTQTPRHTTTTLTTPIGRELVTEFDRFKLLSDPENALTVERWVDGSRVADNITTTMYDRENRTLTSTSQEQRESVTTFDDLGRPIAIEVPGLALTELFYNDDGFLEQIAESAGDEVRIQDFEYDAGFLTLSDDPLGQVTTFSRDAVGRLTGITRPDNGEIGFRLDDNDNLLELTPPERDSHRFSYEDDTNLLSSSTPPTVSGVDSPTNLSLGQNRFDYTDDLRIERVRRSDGRDIEFVYDTSTGQLRTVALERGTIDYEERDQAGRPFVTSTPEGNRLFNFYDGPLLTDLAWVGEVNGNVGFDFDQSFRPSLVIVADEDSAESAELTYDGDNLLLSVGDLRVDRDPDNRLMTGMTLGSITSSFTHNAFSEVNALETGVANESLFSQSIVRDKLGRVESITETVLGETTELSFEYDEVGRLIEATRDGNTTTFNYDANGNRTSITLNGNEIQANFDAQDRILNQGGTEFSQTPEGDLIRKDDGARAIDLEYDELGNLLGATINDGLVTTTIDYVIDPEGRRIGKKVDGELTRQWLYQDALRPAGEIDENGTLTQFLYTGPGAPDAMIRGGEAFRIVKDQLGSVRLVVNADTGDVAQELQYGPFGEVLVDTNPGFQPFGFAGGLFEFETGLVRFGARDYDPEVGRWTSKDPIGFDGGQANLYVYVGNDPINRVDLTGLSEGDCASSIVIAHLTCGVGAALIVGAAAGTIATAGGASLALWGALSVGAGCFAAVANVVHECQGEASPTAPPVVTPTPPKDQAPRAVPVESLPIDVESLPVCDEEVECP